MLGQIISAKPISATEKRPSIPANVDAAVRKALEKLPRIGFPSAQDFVRALGDEHFRHGEEIAAGTGRGPRPMESAVDRDDWGGARRDPGSRMLASSLPTARAGDSSPLALRGRAGPDNFLDFTADGTALVYIGPGEAGSETPQLWIRRWADLDAEPLGATEAANAFVLSPDGREVAFSGRGVLRVVPLDGGPGRTLAEPGISGSGWAPDGAVYFSLLPGGLQRVPELGGRSRPLRSYQKGRSSTAASA